MITEDLVSIETGKLLTEKGFKGLCAKWQTIDDNTLVPQGEEYYRPSLSLAMKWLREVHNIYIEISMCDDGLFTIIKKFDRGKVIELYKDSMANQDDSFEENLEWDIQYCLKNLI